MIHHEHRFRHLCEVPTDASLAGFNRFTSVDYAVVSAAARLAVLDLSDNKIKVVGPEIASLAELNTLDLSNNDIGGGSLGLWPAVAAAHV